MDPSTLSRSAFKKYKIFANDADPARVAPTKQQSTMVSKMLATVKY